ncbi:out at first protein-like [Tubulanus polymorphus]|uniref:out at first protein-like n=1 Tax=Tubulanus polymorphus TaxID=672921 RepID=UPI003DA28CF4
MLTVITAVCACVWVLLSAVDSSLGQLVVNVKNKGGEVMRQEIQANTSHDSISLKFQKADGTIITQFIDFKNDIQIFKSLVLGEEERGQNQYQIMCFVTKLMKNEFISSDAMSKLRQKNPDAIRTPENDKGHETHGMDLQIQHSSSHNVSPAISELCHDASDATYTRDTDLRFLSLRSSDKPYSTLVSNARRLIPHKQRRCKDTTDLQHHCTCRYEICIGWYPCGLKYCRGKDNGKPTNYRCGIKTCRKCRIFDYVAKQKSSCLWDE